MSSLAVRDRRRSANRKQGGKCFWCDVEMMIWGETQDQNHSLLCTAEHLHPKSLGGSNHRENIVAACNGCNKTRKDLPLSAWLHRVKFRLKLAGNHHHFEVILSKLKMRGINASTVGQPSNGPDADLPAASPPLMDPSLAPQG